MSGSRRFWTWCALTLAQTFHHIALIIDWMRTQIRNKENADIFAEAVDPEVYPDYYAVISTPMDISQISDKIQVSEASLFLVSFLFFVRIFVRHLTDVAVVWQSEYTDVEQFRADMKQMFENCRTCAPQPACSAVSTAASI